MLKTQSTYLRTAALVSGALLAVPLALTFANPHSHAVLAILAVFALVWIELAVGGVSQLAVALALPCPAAVLVDPNLPPVRLAIAP